MARFTGSFDNLRDCFCEAGLTGIWTCRKAQYRFDADTGAVAIWWPKTRTIIFQGPALVAERAETALIEVIDFRRFSIMPPHA